MQRTRKSRSQTNIMGDTHDSPVATSHSAHGHGQRTSYPYLDSPSARAQNHPYIHSPFPFPTGTGDQQYQYHDHRRTSRVSLADRPLPVPGTVSWVHRRTHSNSHLPSTFNPHAMSSPAVVTPQIPPLPNLQTQLQLEYPDNDDSDKDEDQIQDHVDYHSLSYPALRIANAATPDVASLTQRGDSDAPAAVPPPPPPPGASQLSHHRSVAYHTPSPNSNYDHIVSMTNTTGNGMAMNGTGMMGNGNSNPLSPRAESIGYWAEGLSHGTHENPPTFVSEEPLTAKTGGMIGEMMDVRMSNASMANLNMGLGGMRAMSIGDALTEVSFANRGPNVDKLRKVYYRLFTHSSGAYPSKWRIHADDPSLAFGLIYTVHDPRTGIASKPLKGGVSALDALDFSRYPLPPNENSTTCPQPLSLSSTSHAELEKSLFDLYEEEDYRLKAFEALGGAIRVPTESYDDLLPVGQDSRWDIFAELHTYLETSFPLVFDTLEVTKVNTYNIVLHWQGSDATLKPVLLTAHQDVVPVEPVTVDAWIHPPYSGYYDGTWIWGRGSSDDKSDLVSQIVTIDTLLKHGFKPRRTIVIAWGIDEEASGLQGAGNLGPYLEKTYGKDGFAMLVDEGGSMIIDPVDSTILAVPDVSEKGYLDVRVEVNVLGGHSSVPPEHTGIGILSALLTEVEANPHTPQLGRTSTPLRSTLCLATYSNIFPPAIRRLALDAGSALNDEEEEDAKLENLMHELIKLDKVYGATLRTSQAIDLVWGGVKVNALPERATGIVDHRIAEFSSVKELQDHITSVLAPVVASFNLSLTAFDDSVGIPKSESAGEVILSDAWGNQLEPSPITPTGESGPWKLLAGTIKATVEATGGGDGKKGGKAVVIPGLTIGNTDTRFYWPLTKHIFRYSHKGDADSFNGGHTINEAVRAEAIMNEIKFFTKLIFNMDETTLFD